MTIQSTYVYSIIGAGLNHTPIRCEHCNHPMFFNSVYNDYECRNNACDPYADDYESGEEQEFDLDALDVECPEIEEFFKKHGDELFADVHVDDQ